MVYFAICSKIQLNPIKVDKNEQKWMVWNSTLLSIAGKFTSFSQKPSILIKLN